MMSTTLKPKKISAIFVKQLKDTLKNKTILIQFLIFPILAFLLTEFVAKANPNLTDNYFVLLFASMYAGFVPMVTTASIISEEKEQSTLKMLILANVKPWQYLLGVGVYVLLLSSLGGVAFAVIGGFYGRGLLLFLLAMVGGSLASILLGASVGMLAANQMSATAFVMPIAMIAGFLPMIALFNKTFERVASVLYTQQISYLVNNLTVSTDALNRILIIFANMAVFMGVFLLSYRKGKLAE